MITNYDSGSGGGKVMVMNLIADINHLIPCIISQTVGYIHIFYSSPWQSIF